MYYLIADKQNKKLKSEKSFDYEVINKKAEEYMKQGYKVYIHSNENDFYQIMYELCQSK